MNGITAGFKRRKFWLRLWIIILAIFFLTPGPKPVLAIESEQARTIGFTAGGIFLASVAAYTIWLSRSDGKGDWAPRGPGGFFIGAYGGGSFVSDSNWKVNIGGPGTNVAGANAHKVISVQPSGVVGAKLGYFFHRFPYLGMESEFSYASHQVRTQNVQFGNIGASFNDTLDNYSFVLRLLGRYGFLPDKEVPFGRLQPYVGLGIGLEILIGRDDTAKNLALDVSAGLRYMWLKNFSTFLEYKFSHQFAVEIDPNVEFHLNGGGTTSGHYTFDYSRHMVVLGVAYHFL